MELQVGRTAGQPEAARIHEFDVKNRLEGDSIFLDFSIPHVMKLPPRSKGGYPTRSRP
jgi:hypothetical protein